MTTIPNPTTRLQQLLRALRAGERAPSAKRSTVGLIALATTTEALSARRMKASTRTTTTPKLTTVSVPFVWGSADLSFPSASRLYRPTGIDSWGLIRTPRGDLHEVSVTAKRGQRVRPEQAELLASAVMGETDDIPMTWDQTVVFL
ncbi:MAG: hypothetical protein WKF57_10545 [Nakamurella sp.]